MTSLFAQSKVMDSKTNASNEVNSYFNGPRIILVELQIPHALGNPFEQL